MKVVIITRDLCDYESGPEVVMVISGTVEYAESLFPALEAKRLADVKEWWKEINPTEPVAPHISNEGDYTYFADEYEVQTSPVI
jgi:hypothetical protein